MGQEPVDPHVSLASPLAAATITVALGDRRQIQLALNISAADPLDLQNEMIDRAMLLLDRQQARYDLEKAEKQIEETGRHLRNFINAIPVAEQQAKHQEALLRVELQGKMDAKKEAWNEGYDAHVSGGRQGEYKPKGIIQSRLAAADADIAKVKDKLEALPKDLEQQRATTLINIQKYQDDLKEQRRKINDLRHLAGLEPYTLFMDEQEFTFKG